MRHGIGLVLLASTVTTAGAQTRTLPYLYFEVWSEKGKFIRPDENGFIVVLNNEKIRLRVLMRVKSCAHYAPSTADNWRGRLGTKPLEVRVIYRADYFELIKAKMAGKTQ
jgi:hypothetical protein